LAVAKETVMLREDQLATRRRVTGIGRLLRLGCLVLLAALGSASALAAGADTSVVVTASANIGGHSPWPKLQEAYETSVFGRVRDKHPGGAKCMTRP
jgi:hypothetical protein